MSINPSPVLIVHWWIFSNTISLVLCLFFEKFRELHLHRKNPGEGDPAKSDISLISWVLEQWNSSWRPTGMVEYQHLHGFSTKFYSQTISVWRKKFCKYYNESERNHDWISIFFSPFISLPEHLAPEPVENFLASWIKSCVFWCSPIWRGFQCLWCRSSHTAFRIERTPHGHAD